MPHNSQLANLHQNLQAVQPAPPGKQQWATCHVVPTRIALTLVDEEETVVIEAITYEGKPIFV